jgi:hypothetical protein
VDEVSGMRTASTRTQTPEEVELVRKLSVLASLETDLAERELELATLQAELHSFETKYLHKVGVLYAELDEIEARIAETLKRLSPDDPEAEERATKARARARNSAQALGSEPEKVRLRFRPSQSLKRLYRDVAKQIHPDLAIDEEERRRRQRLMANANRAYEECDETALQFILSEWERSPESVEGEGTAAELVRTIRKIAQVKERLREIKARIAGLKKSPLCELKARTEEFERKGKDLFAEMIAQINGMISSAKARLSALKACETVQRGP